MPICVIYTPCQFIEIFHLLGQFWSPYMMLWIVQCINHLLVVCHLLHFCLFSLFEYTFATKFVPEEPHHYANYSNKLITSVNQSLIILLLLLLLFFLFLCVLFTDCCSHVRQHMGLTRLPRYPGIAVMHAHDDVIKGNIFRVTGPLCGEFTGDRWIPRTKASDSDFWCFLWFGPE